MARPLLKSTSTMRNEVSLDAGAAIDREGWKRVLLTMTGVAIATIVSVLMLSFAADASPSARPVPQAAPTAR